MKIRATFKSPDAIDYALEDAGINDEDDIQDVNDKLAKWLTYGELITIEFDLENETATVVEK